MFIQDDEAQDPLKQVAAVKFGSPHARLALQFIMSPLLRTPETGSNQRKLASQISTLHLNLFPQVHRRIFTKRVLHLVPWMNFGL